MTGHIGVTRILTRTAGLRAGAAAIAAAAGLLLAAPASAAPFSGHAAQAPAIRHVYRTLVTGLAVREAATGLSMKRAVLGAAGSKVRISCFEVGQAVRGDSVWYHITAPRTGLVPGFYLDTGSDPALGIPSCVLPVSRTYRTLVSGLAVRTAPTPSAGRRAALGPAGTKVTVRCYTIGHPVGGDHVWYRIIAPRAGLVAGFYLSTGRDPATGIRRC